MAELTQAEVVYSPRASIQVWRTLLNWLAFFFQIFSKILRVLNYHPLLSSSTSAPTHAFKPLPAVELSESDFPATVEIAGIRDSVDNVATDGSVQKLTVCLRFIRLKRAIWWRIILHIYFFNCQKMFY